MREALAQAKDYESKIANRVGYLATEEKKLVSKILQVR